MTRREEFRAYMKAANRTSDSNGDPHLNEAQVIAYWRDELSPAEHESAQAHLVSCEQCITLFRNARDFLDPMRENEEPITTAERDEAWRSFLGRVQIEDSTKVPSGRTNVVPGYFPSQHDKRTLSRVTLLLAASLLISLGAVGWQTWRLLSERQSRRQSQEIAMQSESKQRELEQRLSQLEQNGSEELKREREQRLAAEAERDQLQDQLAVIQPPPEKIPDIIARLTSERGTEDDIRLSFTGATKAARLRLLISKPYEFPQYTIEISDDRGRIVREITGLRPAGDDGALSFRVNRATFSPGKYKLRLFGGKEKKQLGEYGLSVTAGG